VLEEATEIARQTNRPYDIVACSYCHGILLFSSGHASEAIKQFREGLDLSREYSINLFIPLIVGQLGAALTLVGSHVQAASLLERVVRESELLGHNIGTVFANYALATAYRAAGRTEESRLLAETCLENARRHGFQGVEARLLLLLGTLQMSTAKPDATAAESFVKGSIDLARSLNALPNVAQGQLGLADIWARAGRPEEAIEAIDSAVHLFDAIGFQKLPDDVSRLRLQCAPSATLSRAV
jgi:tetratricopeptide (TPR) repeat protein